MSGDQLWSCLPAVILKYDGKNATVRPLIKLRLSDGSQIDFPVIKNVVVITPATAFAGVKVPVKAGDKVLLHIADRDIQKLLKTDTSGLGDPGSSECPTWRNHDISDAVAIAGFGSLDSIHESDSDVWIFNNKDQDSYNHIRLKQTGEVEIKAGSSTVTVQESEVSIESAMVKINAPVTKVTGEVHITGNLVATGNLAANGGNVTFLSHKHSSSGNSPRNPS